VPQRLLFPVGGAEVKKQNPIRWGMPHGHFWCALLHGELARVVAYRFAEARSCEHYTEQRPDRINTYHCFRCHETWESDL
jgi:hypothetical protein